MTSRDKKKIAIITRHAVPNYGSFFQTLATECILENLGFYAEIINYVRADESITELIKSYCKRNGGMGRILYYNIFWRVSSLYRNCVFSKARRKYLNLGNLVDNSSINKSIKGFDILMTGSDQVWNVVGSGNTAMIDENYFWGKAGDGQKIISYAASFGDEEISAEDKVKCAAWLDKYDNISVREDTGIVLIHEMGHEAVQVLDPTLLIDRDYWVGLAEKNKKRRKKPYALVYNLHSDSNMKTAAQNRMNGSSLDIVNIISTFRCLPGKNVFCPSVEEFLWLFKNAKCIYADSFHAIAFAVIFKVPFVVTLPKEYSTRLESILRLLGLTERIDNTFKGIPWKESLMDWDHVYSKLETERKKSLDWLKNALS